ncbi:unnamed protein product [Porites lobata]|uniref:SGNH hydrolase-type esterase domain-containing protein n=1 Tax=Porites lobata TaxID=104759 RepID=A0ABN8Q895_9CNID|nr:unnamed protein product [Porites lobata]
MIKNIQGTRLGKAVGHRVVVKSFSGATTKAMKDYLKPNLELSPDQVILHVGTNDLKSKEPQQVAGSVVDLARQIENSSDATVIISELVSGRDGFNEAESHGSTSALPSQRGFKLASLNINKLITHIDQLRILLARKEIDILSINETKLNETISDNEVNISGYDIIRRDRITNGGGGVCFYVKSSIIFTIRNDLNMDTLENLCLEIQKPRSKPFVVATWYRPPDSPIGILHLSKL